MAAKRGALVVIEGCDRCGKSTQCKRLVETLNASGRKAELWNFPDRRTSIGKIINSYLTKEIELDDHAIHLLYSANRWEKVPQLKEKLASGITLVIDRYAFSGVSFSSAKVGMNLEWCKHPDSGLPVPDVLLHLELAQEEAENRGGFGDERYEVSEFQTKVKAKFRELYASLTSVSPTIMDVTGMSIEEVGTQIQDIVDESLAKSDRASSDATLW